MRVRSPWDDVLAVLGLAIGLSIGLLVAERRANARAVSLMRGDTVDGDERITPTVVLPAQPPIAEAAASGPTYPARANPPALLLPEVLIDPGLVVKKASREVSLISEGAELAVISVLALGTHPEGAKQEKGDGRTPEGAYFISEKGDRNGLSFLRLSYPGEADADSALERGVISRRDHRVIVAAARSMTLPPERTALGGGIVIAASGGDWPDGSVILSPPDAANLTAALPLGAEVMLLP